MDFQKDMLTCFPLVKLFFFIGFPLALCSPKCLRLISLLRLDSADFKGLKGLLGAGMVKEKGWESILNRQNRRERGRNFWLMQFLQLLPILSPSYIEMLSLLFSAVFPRCSLPLLLLQFSSVVIDGIDIYPTTEETLSLSSILSMQHMPTVGLHMAVYLQLVWWLQ